MSPSLYIENNGNNCTDNRWCRNSIHTILWNDCWCYVNMEMDWPGVGEFPSTNSRSVVVCWTRPGGPSLSMWLSAPMGWLLVQNIRYCMHRRQVSFLWNSMKNDNKPNNVSQQPNNTRLLQWMFARFFLFVIYVCQIRFFFLTCSQNTLTRARKHTHIHTYTVQPPMSTFYFVQILYENIAYMLLFSQKAN